MSKTKYAGRTRRLAVTALAARACGLSTGILSHPPANHPDIRAAERAGWVKRTAQPLGWWTGRHSTVTVFVATDAGREALARFGQPAAPALIVPGPSRKRRCTAATA